MSVEIELKFIIEPNALDEVMAILSSKSERHEQAQFHLINTYYDTPDRLLGSHHMGLRIRGHNQRYEMTFKSGGQVIAGVVHRPEYNIPLASDALELDKLPTDIWPNGVNSQQLAAQLVPLFSTDFERKTWLISHRESQIEAAIDMGMVKAGEAQEPIHELELELKTGNAADMLALAQLLSSVEGLRLSSTSKAARGYGLIDPIESEIVSPLRVLPLPSKSNVEQGMVMALETILNQWQKDEDIWCQHRQTASAKANILTSLSLIRQVFVLFGGLVPRKATARLRDSLNELEPLIVQAKDARDICFHAIYLQTKLAFMQWLMTRHWQEYIDSKTVIKLEGSFKRFADIMLGRCAAELKSSFQSNLIQAEYLDLHPRLIRNILGFYILAGAYPQTEVNEYIHHWQVLASLGEKASLYDKELARKQAVSQPVFWLNGVSR